MHKIKCPEVELLQKGKIIIMKAIAYKFVNWDVPELDSLKNSKTYRLREKLNQGCSLTRDEKNWLTEKVNTNSYFRRSIPLMGYCFDFSDVLKRFLVIQHDTPRVCFGVDKTSIRSFLYGRVQEIQQI